MIDHLNLNGVGTEMWSPVELFMSPTLNKLKGHIVLWACLSVCVAFTKTKLQF